MGEEPKAHWERGLDGPALTQNPETWGDQAPSVPRMGLGTGSQEPVMPQVVGSRGWKAVAFKESVDLGKDLLKLS